jgi:hypothetical protein
MTLAALGMPLSQRAIHLLVTISVPDDALWRAKGPKVQLP